MTSASLFIVPLPQANPNPKNQQVVQQFFGAQAGRIVPLFQKIASQEPDEDSYYQYLVALRAAGNLPIQTQWSNPFKSDESVPSGCVYGEALNIVWNFMVCLQNRVRSYNCLDASDIDNIKECVRDINTLMENLKYLVEHVQHPVYTVELYHAIESYNKYINGVLFMQIVQNSKPKPNYLIKIIRGIIQCLREVDGNIKSLNAIYSSYFAQFIPTLIKYYNGLMYYQAALEQAEKNEYGVAIAYLRIGLKASQIKTAGHCPFPYVNTQVKMIENTLSTTNQKFTADNTNVYAKFIPEDAPEITDIMQVKMLENLRELLLIFTDNSTAGGPPQGQYPGVPSDSLSTSTLSIPTGTINDPSFFASGSGQISTGPPPAFTPAGGSPPSFTAAGGSPPAFTAAGGASPYGVPPQGNPADTEFPEWKSLCDTKTRIMNRMVSMRQTKPQAAQIIDQYMQQAQLAQQSDAVIQQTIVQFITYGPTPVTTKEGIISMIGQAENFYQQLNDRLDQIEQQFH